MRVIKNTENEITIELDDDSTLVVKPDRIITKTEDWCGDVETRNYCFDDLALMSDTIRAINAGTFKEKDEKIEELKGKVKELKAQKAQTQVPKVAEMSSEDIELLRKFFAELQAFLTS